MKVPNQQPTFDPGQRRLAIVGEAPGEREVAALKPFVGPSGEMLDGLLGHAGISRAECFVGNVSQVRPKANDFNTLKWDGPEVQEGIAALRADLEAFCPTMVLCLGNAALHLFKTGNVAPGWDARKREHRWPNVVSSWRGSLFASPWLGPNAETPNCGVKALATYHPAALLRSPDLLPYVKVDLRRVVQELKAGPGLVLPEREVQIVTTLDDAHTLITDARWISSVHGHPASIDSEGWTSGITHFGWSFQPNTAIVISFVDEQGNSTFTFDEELAIWELIQAWMEDESAPKILQNYLSDAFILAWTYGIVLRGLAHDTLALAWEADCELDKGLATLASLYTREPFWKSKANYRDRLAWVCGMDCAVTLEVAQVLLAKVYGPHGPPMGGAGSPQTVDSAPKLGQEPCNKPKHLTYGNTSPTDSSGPARPPIAAGPSALDNQRQPQQPGDAPQAHPRAGADPQHNGRDSGEDRSRSFDWLRTPRDHYEFNLGLLPAALDVELAGWLFDKEKAGEMLKELELEMFALQGQIDEAAGLKFTPEWAFEQAVKAFARANPKERVEVEEMRWQPMRWNGKKWVKAGKLIDQQPAPYDYIEQATPPTQSDSKWLKPSPKLVKRSVPATITTWEDLERHCKPACKGALRRVRELVGQLSPVVNLCSSQPEVDLPGQLQPLRFTDNSRFTKGGVITP